MTDDPSVVEPQPAEATGGGGSVARFRAYLATTTGKIVLVGGALAVLVVMVAVVGFIVFGAFFTGTPPSTSIPSPSGSGAPPSPPAAESTTVSVIPDIENSEIFTPRDPFEPILIPVSTASSTSTSTTGQTTTTGGTTSGTGTGTGTGSKTTSGTVSGDADTLTLTQIVEENGVRKGVFTIGGQTITAGPKERLGETPWKVVTIGTNSATMMFGDSQVVLTVGEGLQTK